VDDLEMKITHVIRGNDHISNTYKQVLIYRALGMPAPQFAHLPLILGTDRAKISKRLNAVSVTDYREQGYLPEAVLNFLALLGWSPKDEREVLASQELIKLFSLENVNPANPVFDLQKLEWMNGEYIRSYSDQEVLRLVFPFLERENLASKEDLSARNELLLRFIFLLKERCRTLQDFAEKGKYFFSFDNQYEPKAAGKYFNSAHVADWMSMLIERLSILDSFRKDRIEETLYDLAKGLKTEPVSLIHPVRLAVTGVSGGPPLFDILELLGKDTVIKRMEKAVEFIRASSGGRHIS